MGIGERGKSRLCAWLAAFALMQGGYADAASEQGSGKHPQVKQAESVEPAHPALWKIVNGKSTIYLLGSFHALPPKLSWRTPAIDQAIAAADMFAFEANLDFSTAEFDYFLDKDGYLPRGQMLHKMLSPAAQKQFAALINELHLDPNRLDYLRPGVAVLVLQKIYFSARASETLGPGVDAALVNYAKTHGKGLLYLESLETQFDTLAALGGGMDVKMLEKALANSVNGDRVLPAMLAAWVQGDMPRLASLDDADANQKVMLLDNRNRAWLPGIEAMLNDPKTYLVTVGALHLAGANSVIELLCAKGWRVQRIQTGLTPPPPACGT